MKLTVLGGGGVRSPFLTKSIALGAEQPGITEVVLMDNNAEKLHKYGKIAKLVGERCNPALHFILTTDAEEALRDADISSPPSGAMRMKAAFLMSARR